MSDLLDAAIRLADKGFHVFPCGPDKAPRVAGGFKSATSHVPQIREWNWNSGAMIGAAIKHGQVVIDIDPRNGGDETVAALQGADCYLRRTKTVRTKSGGTHLYYRVDPSVELRGSLGPGVDVKRFGKGYVIVPPSEGYTLEPGHVMVDAPRWLYDELKVEPKPEAGAVASPKFFEAFEEGTPYGVKAMESELGKLATEQEGGRNNALNKAAFSLGQLVAGGELNGHAAYEKLLDVALKIGLEEPEARATIASGSMSGEKEPRQAPDEGPIAGLTEFVKTNVMPEEHFWTDWEIDEPEPPFYIRPILPKNAYVLVYGATEAAKSMTTLGILADASRRGIKSSIYSLENPPATDRDRLRRWAPDPAALRLTNYPLDFNDQRQVEKLIEREREWGTDVILIDTYSHAFNSRSDDGNAKAIEFARRVRYVMASVGCSVIVIDHTGYMQEIDPRDASAKRQQVDVAILMKKRGEWVFGQPARFSMKNHKSARFANPFYLEGEIVDRKDRGLELVWTTGEKLQWEES